MAAELSLKSGTMLTQLSPREAWAKHAAYGGPYTPKLFPPFVTQAGGRVEAEPIAPYVSAVESGREDCAVSYEGAGKGVMFVHNRRIAASGCLAHARLT
jgi:hypothetical protein